uniref:Uncharacterized protein n=1 Tax=uncultured marine virus TaxID=186617 RepID=A0A0F7L943_9VIRU|nr:hypothetical protein [uncultured marine virus]
MAVKWDTIDGARDKARHIRDTEGKTCGLYEAVHASVRTRFFAAKGRPSKRDAGVDLRCLALFTPRGSRRDQVSRVRNTSASCRATHYSSLLSQIGTPSRSP